MSAQTPVESRSDAEMSRLGMKLFLLSLGMLFAATMVGYVIIRMRAETWPPPGSPELPGTLWIATAILLAGSGTIHWAVSAAARSKPEVMRITALVTLLLGAAFVILQLLNWRQLAARELTANANMYGFSFYMLTGLHGLHVIGGLIGMLIVVPKAWKGVYSAENHEGLRLSAWYWHFLDGAWIVIFATLLLTS